MPFVTQNLEPDTLHSIDKKKKFSRKRNNEEEGDITYINERNRVFNKKVRDKIAHNALVVQFSSRLRGTTTSTQPKSEQVSNVVPRYSSICWTLLSLVCDLLYLCNSIIKPQLHCWLLSIRDELVDTRHGLV